MLIDRGVGRHLHRLDRLADRALQAAKEAAFPGGEEEDGVAGAASPARAADAMHVGLAIEGDVVVDDKIDPLHVQAAGGDIGGHQHIDPAIPQPLNRAFPLSLGDIAVEHSYVIAVGFEGFGHRERHSLGAGKDDHPFAALGFEHPFQGFEFLGGVDEQIALANAAPIGPFGLDGDLGRILEIAV